MKYLLFISFIFSIDEIIIKGSKFFNKNTGEQFFFKGVGYQPRGQGLNDPLADIASCKRDLIQFKELGLNSIRVYNVEASYNHDECMNLFEQNNIYVLIDLQSQTNHVDRSNPYYDPELLNHMKQKMDLFSKYPNTLLYFVGNEVSVEPNNSHASGVVKLYQRELKKYQMQKGGRYIPIGYASNDHPDMRIDISKYFTCGSNLEKSDFYAINIYEWCGETNFQASGMAQRTEEFRNFEVPVFFSEYGCNLVRPRTFGEVSALYGKEMQDVFSGGLVYEYSEESINYGLVKIENNQVQKLEDYNNFKNQILKVNPKKLNINSYTPQNQSQNCPTQSNNWKAHDKMPTIGGLKECECIEKAVKCKCKKGGDKKKIGDSVQYICNNLNCDSIYSNFVSGVHGPYFHCSADQRASWALNAYHEKFGKCDFDGIGEMSSPNMDIISCKA